MGRSHIHFDVNGIIEKLATEFDELDPLQKHHCLTVRDSGAGFDAEIILLALKAIDSTVMERFEYPGIYVLESSLLAAFNLTFTQCLVNSPYRGILGLYVCQMIYRFTVARRFVLSDVSEKQIRINSWGREYTEGLIPRFACEYARFRDSVLRTLDSQESAYRDLISLLRRPVCLASAREIAGLNASVALKFVH